MHHSGLFDALAHADRDRRRLVPRLPRRRVRLLSRRRRRRRPRRSRRATTPRSCSTPTASSTASTASPRPPAPLAAARARACASRSTAATAGASARRRRGRRRATAGTSSASRSRGRPTASPTRPSATPGASTPTTSTLDASSTALVADLRARGRLGETVARRHGARAPAHRRVHPLPRHPLWVRRAEPTCPRLPPRVPGSRASRRPHRHRWAWRPATASGRPQRRRRRSAEQIEAAGGAVLATYREPLGGHVHAARGAADRQVEPTPFQRDLSDAHAKRLTPSDRQARALPRPDHRGARRRRGTGRRTAATGSTAMKALGREDDHGARRPRARRSPYKILALNIEKAHNLREKSLEVIRMYRELPRATTARERLRARVRGAGARHARLLLRAARPLRRRRLPADPAQVDGFLDDAARRGASTVREARAAQVLQSSTTRSPRRSRSSRSAGLTSPYLKAFVVARVNPLRFMKARAAVRRGCSRRSGRVRRSSASSA